MRRILALSVLLILAGAGCSSKSGPGDSSSTAPAAPSSPTVVSTASVQLAWTASANNPTGYYVEQSTDGTNFGRVATVFSPTVTLSGLPKGVKYYFRVRAYNGGGTSAYSAVVNITP